MIAVDVPATMKCDEPACEAQQPVELCLLGTGSFAFKPGSKEWQVMLPRGDIGSPFRTFCPQHRQEVKTLSLLERGLQVGPAGPKVVNGHGR